jgi:hypothetical protein
MCIQYLIVVWAGVPGRPRPRRMRPWRARLASTRACCAARPCASSSTSGPATLATARGSVWRFVCVLFLHATMLIKTYCPLLGERGTPRGARWRSGRAALLYLQEGPWPACAREQSHVARTQRRADARNGGGEKVKTHRAGGFFKSTYCLETAQFTVYWAG